MEKSAEKEKEEDKPKFYTLTELAKITNSDRNILINIASQGYFPVFIVANNWRAHLWKKPITDDGAFDNDSDISFGEWVRVNPSEEPIHLNNTFLQLKANSLIAYQLNVTANVATFAAQNMFESPEEYFLELRLCDPQDFSKPYEINLKDHELVVMGYWLPIVKKILLESFQAEIELSDNERKKLLRVIGSLAMLIADSASGYKYGKKLNVYQINEKITEVFAKNEKQYAVAIDKTGISSTNMRDIISKGIKELLNK